MQKHVFRNLWNGTALVSNKVALYLRVSTDGQTTENQRIELESVARQRGWDIVAQYDDNGVSGAKGRQHRKQFDAMIKAAIWNSSSSKVMRHPAIQRCLSRLVALAADGSSG